MERATGKTNSARRIFIDTDICIGIMKLDNRILKLLEKYPGRPAISSITAFELLLRRTNIEDAQNLISNADVFSFDENSAFAASLAYKNLKKSISIPYRDFFIAATVMANNGELITLNKKDFENIEGLTLVDF